MTNFLIAIESAWRAGVKAFRAQYRKRRTELQKAKVIERHINSINP